MAKPDNGINEELIRTIVKRRKSHKEWICTRHDACSCDGTDCIYACTCSMKKDWQTIQAEIEEVLSD